MFFKRIEKAVEEPDRKAISAEEEAERRKTCGGLNVLCHTT